MSELPFAVTTPVSVARVGLKARDADRLADFYRTVVGLQELSRDGETITLGSPNRPLMVLERDPAAKPDDPRTAGLFHTAFLVPDRADLGLQQEFPGFFKGNKSIVRLDIFNFLNMLNKDWGQVETLGFYGTRNLVNVKGVENGQYVYDLGAPGKPTYQNFGVYDTYTNPARVVSRWSALLTLKYTF